MSKRDLALRRKLGERIRELRCRRYWSQSDLAYFCHMSAHHLGKIERGAANATLGTLVSIAKILRISLADLFRGLS